MKLTEAIDLIKNAPVKNIQPASWADLGCGDGLFTYALAILLMPGSCIYAIDRLLQQRNEATANKVEIRFQQTDFISDDLHLTKLDGILMANSLHYVKDKRALLTKLKQYLSKSGIFIIVEYDTLKANPWVPYPVNPEQLKQLFASAGYPEFIKTGERESVYGPYKIYACTLKPY